jgi:hypothetical protein
MRVIKDIAITEPLVDVVESRAVLTNAVPILHLDILTCTKEVTHPSPVFLSPPSLAIGSLFQIRISFERN